MTDISKESNTKFFRRNRKLIIIHKSLQVLFPYQTHEISLTNPEWASFMIVGRERRKGKGGLGETKERR